MKEKVAVIGMGISGAGVLLAYEKELPHHPDCQIELDCYDAPESFGKGVPFRETSPYALNNVRSPQISYDYEHEQDFAAWLSSQGKEAEHYAKRSVYGEYMEERSQELIETLGANVYHTRITMLEWLPSKQKWRLTSERPEKGPQEEILYDRVHLCCGELPSRDFYRLEEEPHYVHEAYPLEALPKEIKATDHVAIIGMGLAAIDVLRHLQRKIKPVKIVMFSNENHFPAVRGYDEREVEFNFLTLDLINAMIEAQEGSFTVDNFKQLLDQELGFYGLSFERIKEKYYSEGIAGIRATISDPEEVGLIQAILEEAVVVLSDGWVAMSESERERFAAEYQKMLVTFANPMPVDSANELLDGDEVGWLKVLKGVKDIETLSGSQQLRLVTDTGSVEVDWVINATGMDMSLKGLAKDSLLSDLLDQRYVMVDTAGGFSMNYATSNVISPRYGEWSTLHAHGVLVNGVVYQNNSVFKIQRSAHRLVKRLLAEASIR